MYCEYGQGCPKLIKNILPKTKINQINNAYYTKGSNVYKSFWVQFISFRRYYTPLPFTPLFGIGIL